MAANSPTPDPDYRFFDLQGSHSMMGYELGKADSPFEMQDWWAKPRALPFTQACAKVLAEIHPHLMDELNAYANAQRVDEALLWQQCCRVNLKAQIRAQTLVREIDVGEGCSTFVYYPGEGHAVVGRNYDYWPMQVRRQRLRCVPNCCAFASIGGRGGVPGGRYDGMNQHGLFVSLHVVMTDNPRDEDVQPGVPFHLVVRLALELCRTASEAADLLLHIPHLSSLNYLVADATQAFVIEADPRRVRILPSEGPVLAATNHFRHPDMRPLQNRRSSTNSECRLNFMLQTNKTPEGLYDSRGLTATESDPAALLLARAERVMADRSAPMCGLSGSLTTLWSCVAELRTKRIRYAPGAPDQTAYAEIEPL